MAIKSGGVGPIMLPAAPSIGTAVTSSAGANAYTTAYVQASASTASAIYITQAFVNAVTATSIPVYCNIQIATGASGSETIVAQQQVVVPYTLGTALTKVGARAPIIPPVLIPASTRVALKTADDVASTVPWMVALQCVASTNYVDDAISVTNVGTAASVTNVAAVSGLTVGNLDATVSGRAASYTQPSGFLTAIFPAGTQAGVSNIASGTISVVSSVTNVGAVSGLTVGNLDAAITTRAASYTQPTNFLTAVFPSGTVAGVSNITAGTIANVTTVGTVGTLTTYTGNTPQTGDVYAVAKSGGAGDVAAIKIKTDLLTFTSTTQVKTNTVAINSINLQGTGTVADPWRPA